MEEAGVHRRIAGLDQPFRDRRFFRWSNGQVERMNRTIKDAAVKRYFYDTHNQLKAYLNDFLGACNFDPRLKPLKGLTPYEYLCKLWTQTPDRSTFNPIQQIQGLYT